MNQTQFTNNIPSPHLPSPPKTPNQTDPESVLFLKVLGSTLSNINLSELI
jgi:hypothetical protein